jgi:hypothetical protein
MERYESVSWCVPPKAEGEKLKKKVKSSLYGLYDPCFIACLCVMSKKTY